MIISALFTFRYTLSTPSGNNRNKAGDTMAVRLKARFLSTRVLPTEQYKDFAEHLSKNYLSICQTLGPNLTATRKDEFSKILVNIMHGTGSGKVTLREKIYNVNPHQFWTRYENLDVRP